MTARLEVRYDPMTSSSHTVVMASSIDFTTGGKSKCRIRRTDGGTLTLSTSQLIGVSPYDRSAGSSFLGGGFE